MAEWFATARNTLRRDRTATAPISFERICLCGEHLVSRRDQSPHSIVCGRCGRSWFVLPRDAYPWPKSRKKKRKQRSSRKKTAVPNPSAQDARPAADVTTASPKHRSESSAETPPEPSAEPVLRIGPSWTERVRSRLRRGARPIRLIVTVILLLVLLTGIWLWRQAREREAAATLVAAVPTAEAAIDQGNLLLAAESMGRAVAALDILDADDATARRIRGRHRELVALTQLASLAPYDLAAEAANSAHNPQRWSSRFATVTAGQWVILDVPLGNPRPATTNRPKLPEPAESSEEEKTEEDESEPQPAPAEMVIPLELPLLAGETPVRLEVEAERFEQLASLPRAIIAAQYASWRLMTDSTGQPVWVVRFNPETSFAWTSADLYEAAGFDLDDPILPARKQLARQAEILGVRRE